MVEAEEEVEDEEEEEAVEVASKVVAEGQRTTVRGGRQWEGRSYLQTRGLASTF